MCVWCLCIPSLIFIHNFFLLSSLVLFANNWQNTLPTCLLYKVLVVMFIQILIVTSSKMVTFHIVFDNENSYTAVYKHVLREKKVNFSNNWLSFPPNKTAHTGLQVMKFNIVLLEEILFSEMISFNFCSISRLHLSLNLHYILILQPCSLMKLLRKW